MNIEGKRALVTGGSSGIVGSKRPYIRDHPSDDYHNDCSSVRVSIEGRGSPPILASKPRNR